MPELTHLAVAYGALAMVSALLVYAIIPSLMPLFQRYALARPNARSSHVVPVPQGGGIPIIGALILVTAGVFMVGAGVDGRADLQGYYGLALAGALALALLGANDDIRPMPVATRFAMQAIISALVAFAAPDEWRLLPSLLPVMLERALVALTFVWMINLTNFMDGIDGIVVAGVVPALVALATLALAWGIPFAGAMAAVLAGGIMGFAPHNSHPAKLYLGDAGSLPIGFVLAALLFHLAATVSIFAALLLPLYFVMDATVTLVAGFVAGEDVSKPHRRHAYQRAVDRGWPPPRVTRWVWVLNAALAVLAGLAAMAEGAMTQTVIMVTGLGLTSLVINRFRTAP